jgi:hypothetical protein
MKTNLDSLTGPTPLYVQYDRQTQPQDAYVEIHADGTINYESNSEIGNAVPVSVWNRRIRRIKIPNHFTATGYQQLHDYLMADLEILINGMDEKWDGNNWVGTLSEEARETLDQLEQASGTGEWEDFETDEEEALAELTES